MLAGCSGTVQESLGLGKRAPDEFQIVRRQPLIMPPDFTLRPPEPGATGPADRSTSAQAREVLTGTDNGSPDGSQSSGELALVKDAKGAADPDIRGKILEENTELVNLDESKFLMIFDFQKKRALDQTGASQTIDPSAEAARLRAEGVASTGPITVRTGSTPLAPPASGS
jgi:hypothetical protein